MPELDFALLAAAATSDGEVFNLLGAGVEELRVQQLPAVTLLHVVARWDWQPQDQGRIIDIRLTCRCKEDGTVLHEATFAVGVPRSDRPGRPGSIMTALPLHLESFGHHEVDLAADGSSLKVLPFHVLRSEPEPSRRSV